MPAPHPARPQEEAREAGDLVFVRAEERYSNLPDKVLQVMRFVASGRGGRKATHLLKTDDDCYVRMQNVLAAITVRLRGRSPALGVALSRHACKCCCSSCPVLGSIVEWCMTLRTLSYPRARSPTIGRTLPSLGQLLLPFLPCSQFWH